VLLKIPDNHTTNPSAKDMVLEFRVMCLNSEFSRSNIRSNGISKKYIFASYSAAVSSDSSASLRTRRTQNQSPQYSSVDVQTLCVTGVF
jgi:hypothetical protein